MNTFNVPIFDSLIHSTSDGKWMGQATAHTGSVKNLNEELADNGINWHLAVGMEGIGAYNEKDYAIFVTANFNGAVPVAFVSPGSYKNRVEISNHLKSLKEQGYSGIKLHPRLGKFDLTNAYLKIIIKESNQLGMVPLLCTYNYTSAKGGYKNNPEQLIRLLENISTEKIILMHSGGVRVLEFMEIARSFNNVLLDLSFTILKYTGSSIDLDLQYLFQNFDRRICIGSDYPEFHPAQLRSQFELLSKGITQDKKENIAFRNLLSYMGMTGK